MSMWISRLARMPFRHVGWWGVWCRTGM